MGRLFVAGDLHGSLDIKKLTSKNWKEQRKLTEEDVLVQLGDFGNIWSPETSRYYGEEMYWRNWLGSKKYTFAFVDGNHENFHLLNQFPIVEKWGGSVHIIETDNKPLYHLIRGEVYNINGNKCIALGGAESQDKQYRIEGISWWRQEVWTTNEVEYIVNQIIKHQDIEVVLAHTCPKYVADIMFDNIFKGNCTTGKDMNQLYDLGLKPSQWHFGHYHQTKEMLIDGVHYMCHYNGEPQEI